MLRDVLLSPRFALFWASTSLAYVMVETALLLFPLLATHLTRSPLRVSLVAFAITAPWLVVSLLSGALIDRIDRRRMLLAVNGGRVVIFGVLALAWGMGQASLPLLIAAAFIFGISNTFIEPTMAAMTPAIVAEHELVRANTRLVGVQFSTELLGFPLGGALLIVGLAFSLGVTALGFLLAVLLLLPLTGAFTPRRAVRRHIVHDIREGLGFLWQLRTMRVIALIAAVINACFAGWAAAFVLHAVRPGPLGLSSFAYGLMFAAIGAGSVLGTFLARPVTRRLGGHWAIALNILSNAIGFGVVAITSHVWLIAASLFLSGIGAPMWAIAVTTWQQRAVPDELRGRVAAGYRFIGFGAMSAGALLAGLLAENVSLRAVFILTTVLTLATLIPFARIVRNDQVLRTI